MKNERRPLPWFKQALKQTVEFQGPFLVVASFNRMLFGVKQITGSHTMEKSAAGGRTIDFMEKKVGWRRRNTEGFRASMWSACEAEPCKLSFKWSFKDYHLNKTCTVFLFSCLPCFCITFAKMKFHTSCLHGFTRGVWLWGIIYKFFLEVIGKTSNPNSLCDHWSRTRIISYEQEYIVWQKIHKRWEVKYIVHFTEGQNHR